MVYFFYAIGSISIVVNVATLVIIIRRSAFLLPEIRAIAIFQQVRQVYCLNDIYLFSYSLSAQMLF